MTTDTTATLDAAEAFDRDRIAAMRVVAECADGGWFVGDTDLAISYSGAATFTANGLMSADPDVPVEQLDAVLARLDAGQHVRSVQLGADPSPAQVEFVTRLGLQRRAAMPTMTLDLTEPTPDHTHTHVLREVGPDDSDALARCMMLGMGRDTITVCRPFTNRKLLARAEVTGYAIPDEDGALISMGILIQTAQHVVGLYTIATLPEHRAHGHGEAITRALVSAARDRGATHAYLQATPLGAGVYQRIGFRDAATRTYYTAPAQETSTSAR